PPRPTWRARPQAQSASRARAGKAGELPERAESEAGEAGRNDGEGRNRTGDTTVFSRVLYQLSYLAAAASVAGPARKKDVRAGATAPRTSSCARGYCDSPLRARNAVPEPASKSAKSVKPRWPSSRRNRSGG